MQILHTIYISYYAFMSHWVCCYKSLYLLFFLPHSNMTCCMYYMHVVPSHRLSRIFDIHIMLKAHIMNYEVGHILYSNVVEGWTSNYKCQDPKWFVCKLQWFTMENFQFSQMLFALKESCYEPLDDYIYIIESWIQHLDMPKQYIWYRFQILVK
jgi:hypothetical protein